MHSWNLLLDIVILLATSLVLGACFARIRQSPLVGYILAGMFLGGPGSLAIVQTAEHIEVIAELGVSLLLFSLGLEFSWHRLRSLGTPALLGGVLQVALTAAIASVVLWAISVPVREALAIGAMVSLSSTACVLRMLMERGESDSIQGRNAIAILLVQDMAVVPHAIVLTMLSGSGELSVVLADLGKLAMMVAALVLALYLIVNQVAVRALARLTLEQNRELTILLAIVLGLGSAWAAHAIQISPALGAFIAGMFLGSSRFATQVRADISPLRVLLLTLFFSSAGMLADPLWISNHLSLVFFATAALLLGKTLAIWLILTLIGQPTAVGLSTAIVLSQIGEFALVLGAIAQKGGVLRGESYQLVVSVAILSMFLTPYLIAIAPRVGAYASRLLRRRVSNLNNDTSNGNYPRVFIIGFGPAGEGAAAALVGAGPDVYVLDLNQTGVARAEALGFSASIGDARQVEVLEHAGLQHSSLVLISIPDFATASIVLHHVRRLAESATVISRSRYHRNTEELARLGADVVVGDEEEVGKKLARAVADSLNGAGQNRNASELA